MDLKLLDTLKDRLLHGTSYSDAYTYFLDHFGEDPAFIALGDRTDHPWLEKVLLEVGKQLFPSHIVLSDLRLTRLQPQQFVHGACWLNGLLASVLYFEDVHTGLIAVVVSSDPPETKFARFSGRPAPRRWQPSTN